MTTYRIYCDESCHLERDRHRSMVLGAVWCPEEKSRAINIRLRELKEKHGLSSEFEIKWTKVSLPKARFYLDLLDFFFDDDDLCFRALIAPKENLNHSLHEQTHDDWYYKMYFTMLKNIISPEHTYEIFIDIKDTHGHAKTQHLREVLSNNMYDFSRSIISSIQQIRSHEANLLQLTDLLTGIMSYTSRELTANAGKMALISRMKERSGLSLTKNTLMRARKVNLFIWKPSGAEQ